jgi:hypothetical protein
VEGTVVDESNDHRIPNAQISLVEEKQGGNGLGRHVIKVLNADENGDFSFSFDAKDGYYYIARASAANFYEGEEGGSIKSGRANNKMRIILKAKGYIKVNLVNEPPIDTIQCFSTGYLKGGGVTLYNISQDMVIIGDNPPGDNIEFTYAIQRNGIFTDYKQVINVTPLDTTNVVVKY